MTTRLCADNHLVAVVGDAASASAQCAVRSQAVDTTVQGRSVGAWLLRDAMLRTLNAAESVGIRVLRVHAIDDKARAFHERHGFERSPTDPLNLQMLIKDLRAAVDHA